MFDEQMGMDRRPSSEIMAEARELQGRHAPRLLKAVARRLCGAPERMAGEPAAFAARQLTPH